VLQAWAVLEWKRDDLVAANELFEKAITYKPGDGGVYQAYAMLLRDRKLYSSARAMYVSPTSPSFLLSLSLFSNKQTNKHTHTIMLSRTETHIVQTHTHTCTLAANNG
jgi:Tfp pilus assembly protein PilF